MSIVRRAFGTRLTSVPSLRREQPTGKLALKRALPKELNRSRRLTWSGGAVVEACLLICLWVVQHYLYLLSHASTMNGTPCRCLLYGSR